MTGKDILMYNGNLNALANKKLPAKLALIISANAMELGKWATQIDAQRMKIAERYAEKDKDGKAITEEKDGKKCYRLTNESADEFTAEYLEFLDEEIEGVEILKYKQEDLGKQLEDPRYDALTLAEVGMLMFMLD